jgi:ubiquinone/menaquinone biosynthesis C-methylase UbiE
MTDTVISGNVYDKYGSSNFIYRRLVKNFRKRLFAMLEQGQAQSILEVGCGEGYWLLQIGQQWPQSRLIGLDLGMDVIQEAQKEILFADFLQGGAECLPFASSSFDCILALEVLEHLLRPADAVTEFARVSARYCLVSVPFEPYWRILNLARLYYLRTLGNTPGHVQHFGHRSLKKLLSTNFNIVSYQVVFPWLMLLAEK